MTTQRHARAGARDLGTRAHAAVALCLVAAVGCHVAAQSPQQASSSLARPQLPPQRALGDGRGGGSSGTDGGGSRFYSSRERTRRVQQALADGERLPASEAPAVRPRGIACDATASCYYPGVQVHMEDGAGMTACVDCNDPTIEGMYVDTWENAFRPRGYAVTAELVYAVPNDAQAPLLNSVGGTAVLIDRGNVSFAAKAQRAQAAGAVAVVIRDDGSCGDDFACGARVGSRAAGDMARHDDPAAWSGVTIPVVMVSDAAAARLVALMRIQLVRVDGMGWQRYCPGYGDGGLT